MEPVLSRLSSLLYHYYYAFFTLISSDSVMSVESNMDRSSPASGNGVVSMTVLFKNIQLH